MEELNLRPVEPERTTVSTRSEFYSGIPYLYLEDIAAIYRVFWDLTRPAREERLVKLAEEEKRLAELAEEETRHSSGENDSQLAEDEERKSHTPELDDENLEELKEGVASLALLIKEDKRYSEFAREIALVGRLPDVMQSIQDMTKKLDRYSESKSPEHQTDLNPDRWLFEYYSTPEISMKSDEFYFDDLNQLKSLRRKYINKFDIRTRIPWNSISIGGLLGVYVSFDVSGPDSEKALRSIDAILRRRRNRALWIISSRRTFGPTLAALVILTLLLQFLDEGSTPKFLLAWVLIVGQSLFIAGVIISVIGGRTKVIPRYKIDSQTLFRGRGTEIAIGAIGVIATIVGILVALLQD